MAGIKVEWSVEAKSDLFDILDFYIKRNGNADYSKKLNSRITGSIKFLTKNPFSWQTNRGCACQGIDHG